MAVPNGTVTVRLGDGLVIRPGLPQNFQLETALFELRGDQVWDLVFPRAHRLTVHVQDQNGTPLSGADVVAASRAVSGLSFGSALPPFGGSQSLAGGKSDANGDVVTFGLPADLTIDVGYTSPEGSRNQGTFAGSTRADGTLTASLTIVAPARISGVLRDAAGAPLADVNVDVSGPNGSGHARTASDGSYALAVPNGTVTVRLGDGLVIRPGLPQNFQLETASFELRGDQVWDLVFPRAHRLTVHVQDQNGTPLSGADVVAASRAVSGLSFSSALPPFGGSQSLAGGKSDANGDVVTFGLPADLTIDVGYTSPDGSRNQGTFAGSTRADGTFTASLTIVAPARISGVLRDAAGAPLADVNVDVSGPNGSGHARTASDGSYALAVPNGTVTVRLGDGLVIRPGLPQNFQLETASFELRGDQVWDLVFPRAHRLTVHVQDQNGTPLSGADVVAASRAVSGLSFSSALPPFGGYQSLAGGKSDANGDVVTFGLPADLTIDVAYVSPDGSRRTATVRVVLGQSDATVTAQVAAA